MSIIHPFLRLREAMEESKDLLKMELFINAIVQRKTIQMKIITRICVIK